MTTTETGWTSRAQRLADLLRDRGDIRSPQWHEAVAEVPRHLFVPHAYEQDDTGNWTSWDTAGRLDRVYAPETLVTALEERDGYQAAVSSSTKPDLMVRMLETLDVRDGHHVLEIGTGTGYNAALLSHRLGDDRVFSVDVDPGLVALARERLAAAGYRPTLAAVDGEAGLSEHAPYDRIIATCSVPAVPWCWAEQLAPDGAILVDYKLAVSAGNLVNLRRRSDVLEGRFTTWWAGFMEMRHPQDRPIPAPRVCYAEGERRWHTTAPVPPWQKLVVWFLAHLVGLPRGVVYGSLLDPDTREPTAATLAAPDGSWARVGLADHTVTEAGKTSLWEPVESAYRLWLATERPGWA
ncbi:methyltransferase domain-containing protein [Amycolatopsis taiwanensis]|uniref:methyltransferase domain-containing protein n=1 Tax=Amycolatopsis taiwanensis TaxID=342230 RepID=UPI0004B435AD|nr:methyltransferase domain-containing protein [Amycolatopsis taiwanensis]